ncbi:MULTISPECIES: hypothetical protein [unclassified Crossiella]|uniref:hypothetical protein n=1 Tax=unclassified Crossiella TaxID=2620835 RepID=UPI001FFF3DF3|nr:MULTISPECIES: hypothetical protein [unclassified Crossiella]MCK2239377.1 hypothetical protein [Crossiella sp. S99.2]MCK2252072.1 hypothetical protein [Crossiella sp. S99.1]
MSTSKAGRSRPHEGLADLVAEVVRSAASAPLSPADPIASVSALLLLDPRNQDHLNANVTVIVCDALSHPARETNANRWRNLRPTWVRPPTVGATTNGLTRLGVLRPTGKYVPSTDRHGKNLGKLVPVYRLDLKPLADNTKQAKR